MIAYKLDIDAVVKNSTVTLTFSATSTVIDNMNAERPSEEGGEEDPGTSHGEESDSDCSWDGIKEERGGRPIKEESISSDEQPGTSRQTEGGVTHPCTFPGCKLVFRRPGRLKAHMHLHNGQRPFKCSLDGCLRSYTTSSHLKRHLKVFHIDGPKRSGMEYMCSRCTKTNKGKGPKRERKCPSKYVKEYCAHSLAPNICFKCGEAFRYVRREPKPGNSLTLCHVCGHCFETGRDFRRHERGHITYDCPYIGCKTREFSYVDMRRHTSQHHTGYICNDCKKRFSSKAMLQDHVACHQDVRQVIHCPFLDAGCERKYYHLRNLKQHIITAHNKRRFVCEICSDDFSSKQKLTCHKARKHSEDAESECKSKHQPKKARKGPKLLKPSMVHVMLGIRVIDETGEPANGEPANGGT